jgi:hypothetical protein
VIIKILLIIEAYKKKLSDRDVDKFFKTFAKSKNNWPNILKLSVRWGKKTLANLAREFTFLLTNLEFYSHFAIWRVAIRTPVSDMTVMLTDLLQQTKTILDMIAMLTDVVLFTGLKFLVRLCTDLGLKDAQEYANKLKKAEKAKELRDQVGGH